MRNKIMAFKHFFYILSLALTIVLASCFSSENPLNEDALPFIQTIVPDIGVPGDTVSITGLRFGAKRDTNIVKIGDIIATQYISWSETVVKFIVPEKSQTGELKVRVDGFTSNYKPYNVLNTKIEMIPIIADTVRMGSDAAIADPNEIPVRNVILTRSFSMSKYEINQAQWRYITRANPSRFKHDSLPVEGIKWIDIIEFCNELSAKDGLTKCYIVNGNDVQCNFDYKGYRLPTEAEWEFACRAGTNFDFYKGNITHKSCSPLDSLLSLTAWYCGNYKVDSIAQKNGSTQVSGRREANKFGLFDMIGNVYEYCWDWYAPYNAGDIENPTGATSGTEHVIRGGSVFSGSEKCRSSARRIYSSDKLVGFRIVKTD